MPAIASAPSVGGHRERRQQERHVVRARDFLDAEIDRQPPEESTVVVAPRRSTGQRELEAVVTRRHRALQEVADAAIGVGQGLREPNRSTVLAELEQRDVDPRRRTAALGVEDVGRDRRRGVGHRAKGTHGAGVKQTASTRTVCSEPMSDLRITVGDLAFEANWEREAPQTIEAIRRMLPITSRLIHCRWSGESTWIPYGDFRPGIDYENHTSHPAPGMLAMYPGGISECEIFFPHGACTTSSKVGQLAANHFATIVPDEGWQDRLREVGRRCLWDGAQPITIREVG